MADNAIYIPHINPVKFFAVDRANIDAHFTKHFDDFPFDERLYDWQDPVQFTQLWQTTDIIYLQFESTFDPITVELVDENGTAVITLPAIVGLPNIYYPNTYSYEVEMSLATVATGCYKIKVTAGSGGSQRIFISGWQHVSEEPYERSTLLLKYKNSRFHEDVIFETGIEFQVRIPGYLGFLKPGINREAYKDQKQNPTVLSSRTFRGFQVVFGDEFGLPDDTIDLLNRIWGCDTVQIDGKYFTADAAEFELLEVDNGRYPKRGVKLQVAEGLNRASSVFIATIDTGKKLNYGIVVDAKVWGDTSNQGSANTVPIETVE